MDPVCYSYFNEVSPEMDLLAASSVGDLGLVHRLLQQGANVDQPNESGWTPLMYAAHYGHYNVVKMLIDYGANVNICEKSQGRTPLMLAASCGHTRCLEVLITLGAADIEMVDSQGHNAAYYAIHSGHGRNKIIAKLLKIQGKSRSSSSSSSSNNNSNSTASNNGVTSSSSVTSSTALSSGGGGGGGGSGTVTGIGSNRIRPLTKGRSEVSSTSGNNNHLGPYHHTSGTTTTNNSGKYSGRGHNNSSSSNNNGVGTISSSKISSTTKPEIIISQDKGQISDDSSPFPHGTGNSNKMNNDSGNCAYYSPHLPLSRDASPLGDQQYTPSSTSNHHHFIPLSNKISSPFDVTPQLTFDRLIGKRRLPMVDQVGADRFNNGQPAQKTIRRDQVITCPSTSTSSSSEVVYNLLASANWSSHQHQQISKQQSILASTSSPSSPLPTTSTSTSTTIHPSSTSNEEKSNLSSSSASFSKEINNYAADDSSLPATLSDASTSSLISSSSRSSSLDGGSRSPLPENLDTLLERIGLSTYVPLFASHGIDLYCFLTLNESDLDEIGITMLGHKRKLYMAQLRFRESVEIASTQERFFADWLLSERENLKKENHELKMKLKGVETY